MAMVLEEDRPTPIGVRSRAGLIQGNWMAPEQPVDQRDWDAAIDILDFAFQPIVNVHSGVCFGFEALLRRYEDAGFDSIADVFDSAFREDRLYAVELKLREKAIRKFTTIKGFESRKLFYNLDNRFIDMSDYHPGRTGEILSEHGLSPNALVFEVSERHDVGGALNMGKVFENYRAQGYKLALDDYGVGFSQLKMLYHCEPDVLKIDRFFITGIQSDKKKEMLVSQLVSMAHLTGTSVIAEGVETEAEFFVCKRLGCDLIQGFLVQKPKQDVTQVRSRYDFIEELAKRDRRGSGDDWALIESRLQRLQAIALETPLPQVFEYFHDYREVTVVPVVDDGGHPVGVIREQDFKAFSYSRFGRELIHNPAMRLSLQRFLLRCPVVNRSDSVERILETFASASNRDGVIVVDNMRYIGFLDSLALIEILNEKNTLAARDQNPLTQLPGNTAIFRYASQVMAQETRPCQFFYFDFDNFKPFNDAFGFRQGDRAILLFADILRKQLVGRHWFIGHIGGDDFFVGASGYEAEESVAEIKMVLEQYRDEITTFYDPESKAKGYLDGVNREGKPQRFPLMTVSAAMLELPPGATTVSFDDIAPLIFQLKKNAKGRDDHFCAAGLGA